MKLKIDATLKELDVDIEKDDLHPDFVEKYRQFKTELTSLKAAETPEEEEDEIKRRDDELVSLFNELHETDEFEEDEAAKIKEQKRQELENKKAEKKVKQQEEEQAKQQAKLKPLEGIKSGTFVYALDLVKRGIIPSSQYPPKTITYENATFSMVDSVVKKYIVSIA